MKRAWMLALLAAIIIPSVALSQPTIESIVTLQDNTDTNTYTTGNVTVPAESNLGMGICVTSGEHSDDPRFTTPPTWSLGGGEAFSKIVIAGETGQPTTEDFVAIYYLVNPTVGTGTISWTHTDTLTSTAATVFVLSGAAQTNPTVQDTDPDEGNSSHSGSWTINLTTTVDNSLMFTCGDHGNGTIAVTHGAGQTEQSDFSANGQRHWTSTEVQPTAGLEVLTANNDSGTPAGRFAAIAIEPFVAPRRVVSPLKFE